MYFCRIKHAFSDSLNRDTWLEHSQVWRFFSDVSERERDFLFRWDQVARRPVIYAVSKREPMDVRGWSAEAKTYDPVLKPGTVLRFDLRINPVKAVKTEPGSARGKRADVVIDFIKRNPEKAKEMTRAEIIHNECLKWLQSRAESSGFRLAGGFRAEAFQRRQFFKKKAEQKDQGTGRKAPRITMTTVDLTGYLEVLDEERFRQTLFEGLGPGKGFGCGLLLVRRP